MTLLRYKAKSGTHSGWIVQIDEESWLWFNFNDYPGNKSPLEFERLFYIDVTPSESNEVYKFTKDNSNRFFKCLTKEDKKNIIKSVFDGTWKN